MEPLAEEAVRPPAPPPPPSESLPEPRADSPRLLWMRRALRALGWLPLALVLAVVLYKLRPYLAADTLPARGDPSQPFRASYLTPLFWPWALAAIRAVWDQASLALWNPYMTCGGPQLASPGAGVLGLSTWLGGLFAPDAAVRISMLLHALAGMVGTFALARALAIARPFAAVGAFAFGLGPFFLERFFVGHLNMAYAIALMPWVLFQVWKALTVERGFHRWALGAGAVVGFQLLEGGDVPLVYEQVALAGLVVVLLVGPDRRRQAIRLVASLALLGAASVAVSALQLLPMLDYMALTGRQGGIPLELAKLQMEGPPPALDKVLLGVAAFGAATLVVRKQARAALWLCTVCVAGWAIANYEDVFALMYRVFPGFRYQRIPSRSLMLLGAAGPVLVAASVQGVWSLLRRWWWLAAPASLALALFLGHRFWSAAPEPPRMASLSQALEGNHALNWLAREARGSRIHTWESINRHWGADNATLPLGLEVLASFHPAEHHDYLPSDFDEPGFRTYLSESYGMPARFWGMLNVRYVTSTVPRSDPGFRLAATVERCPPTICQPVKVAGPFIYENEQWLPRAWRVGQAVALVGESRKVFEASLDVMKLAEFDPRRTVVLHLGKDDPRPPVALALAVGEDLSGLVRWEAPEGREAMTRALREAPGPVSADVAYERLSGNRLKLQAPAEGWLVVSERLKLFPGWEAWAQGEASTILRADGVLGALQAPPGAEVVLRYRPPGFLTGALVLFGALAVLAAFEIRARRRP